MSVRYKGARKSEQIASIQVALDYLNSCLFLIFASVFENIRRKVSKNNNLLNKIYFLCRLTLVGVTVYVSHFHFNQKLPFMTYINQLVDQSQYNNMLEVQQI